MFLQNMCGKFRFAKGDLLFAVVRSYVLEADLKIYFTGFYHFPFLFLSLISFMVPLNSWPLFNCYHIYDNM